MKNIFAMITLCALTMSVNAAYRIYLCGITELTVDTLQSSTKNQFTLHFHQKCKNTAEYNKPETFYESDVKLVLNSDDRTLEGTYTTEGASTTSSSANVNDQTINLITSEFTSGSTSRSLRKDSISTFTIEKIGENQYAITTGNLVFSQRVNQTDTWAYRYSYDANHILEEGISKTPFVFGYSGEYVASIYNYDMTVNGINVMRDDNDYGSKRYFLTLSCVGKNRETNAEHNYEVQLAIYPTEESIVGSYSTQGSSLLLYASFSYVKDLKINKQRYLANDSLSTIQIKSKGTNLYSFFGGTLTCTDIDANYSAVYGKKRIEAVHYYHFSDNDGAGIEFGYDETNKTIELHISNVAVSENDEGFALTINATSNGLNYVVFLDLLGESIDGTFKANEGLGLWSKVERGSSSSYITSGTTVSINSKGGNKHTISGNLLCENDYTYILKAFDFEYGLTQGIDKGERLKVKGERKVLRDGQLYIMYEGQMYDVQGKKIED